MNDSRQSGALSGPGIMLLSAALFGYFGFFYIASTTTNASGQFVPVWFVFLWTLRGSAIAFAVSAAVWFLNRWGGNLLYSLGGIVSAILFVVVIVMDHLDKQHGVISPIFLALFAAWNGYGAWTGLMAVLAARSPAAPRDTFAAPGS